MWWAERLKHVLPVSLIDATANSFIFCQKEIALNENNRVYNMWGTDPPNVNLIQNEEELYNEKRYPK